MARVSSSVRALMADMESMVNHRVRTFCADVAVELRIRTPKDTHFASVNWIWDNKPNTEPQGDQNVKPGQKVSDSYFLEGLRRLKSWTIHKGDLFMTNAVDYIGEQDPRGCDGLDAGYSRKAPAGFVRKAIEKVVRRYQ